MLARRETVKQWPVLIVKLEWDIRSPYLQIRRRVSAFFAVVSAVKAAPLPFRVRRGAMRSARVHRD